ncbi:hypothetical protein ABW20_dc0100310 [Dactylellina cionopaga]|nr:hypothetical protein ABW20_dc0100310 [Dactylellina cionopaga]
MVEGDDFLHAALSPWQSEQIAVIDAKGRWSVWDFTLKHTHRRRFSPVVPKQVAAGHIYASDTVIKIYWANLTWGSTKGELLVATRKDFLRVNIKTGQKQDFYKEIVQDVARDVKLVSLTKYGNEPNKIVLLTNYALHILHMNPEIKPVLCTIRVAFPLNTIAEIYNGMTADPWIFLYSRYNPNITILRGFQNTGSMDLSLLVAKGSNSPIIGIVPLEGSTEPTVGKTGQRRMETFALLWLGSNYDLWKQDYTLNPNLDVSIFRPIRKPKRGPLSNRIIDTSDEDSSQDENIKDFGGMDLGLTFEKLTLGTHGQEAGPPILDLSKIYDKAFEDESTVYRTGSQADGESFLLRYLNKLEYLLQLSNETRNPGFLSLLQLKTQFEGLFDDLNLLFTEISNLVFEMENAKVDIVDIEPLLTDNNFSSSLLALSRGSQDRMITLNDMRARISYDGLSDIWLESLPINSPAKLRLRRERLARMVSIDVGLSSLGFYPKLAEHNQRENSTISNQEVGLNKPGLYQRQNSSFEPLGDRAVGIEHAGISNTDSRDLLGGRMAYTSPGMFIEKFSPITHMFVGDANLEGLLNDWDVDQSPNSYQWRPISSLQHESSYRSQSSRRGPRIRSRRRGPASFASTNASEIRGASESLPVTQPTTRTELSVVLPISSFQVGSSQRFPSSQIQRGKYGDSRKTKKRRTEGF